MVYGPEAFKRFASADEVEPHEKDTRTPFGHDRDRIIYSSAFRRLAGKAQVVSASEPGLFHTRLTHTLKVAQLGRRIAEQLRAENVAVNGPASADEVASPDPDLVEAACLAHDLGHPPFGHIGERAIQRVFDDEASERFRRNQKRGEEPSSDEINDYLADQGGFEANAQTFRLLRYLSVRATGDGRNGLNLTRAVLDATTKYPWTRADARVVKKKKWNTYGGSDLKVMEAVRAGEQAGLYPFAPQAFEAQIMEWADDVTYVVHDLMDFFKTGQVPLHELLLTESGRLSDLARDFLLEESNRTDAIDEDRAKLEDAWTYMALASDLTSPWTQEANSKAEVQTASTQLIGYFVNQVGWVERGAASDPAFVCGTGRPLRHEADLVFDQAFIDSERKRLGVELLKRVIEKYIHKRPDLETMEHGQRKIVEGLVEMHYRHPEMLPVDRAEELAEHGDDLRAAVDHVSSLTEVGATALYARLTGADLGNLSDVI
jgi:dGTPase